MLRSACVCVCVFAGCGNVSLGRTLPGGEYAVYDAGRLMACMMCLWLPFAFACFAVRFGFVLFAVVYACAVVLHDARLMRRSVMCLRVACVVAMCA